MTQPARGTDPQDDDARFAEIVSHLQEDGWSPEGDGQGEESRSADRHTEGHPQTDDKTAPGGDGGSDVGTATNADERPRDPLAGLPTQWRMPPTGSASVLDDDPDFQPSEPEPLPAGDLHFWGAVGGIVIGPLWLLYLFFFDRYARPLWWVAACAVAIGGLVLLILRQPADRGDDWDDEQDGARL